MAWSPLYNSNICQKRILAHILPLIYCEAKIVADSLFVDLFHAVAVRTTLLFRVGIPCQNHQCLFPCHCCLLYKYSTMRVARSTIKVNIGYTTAELVVIRKFCARLPRKTTLFICLPKPYIFRNDQRCLSYQQ